MENDNNADQVIGGNKLSIQLIKPFLFQRFKDGEEIPESGNSDTDDSDTEVFVVNLKFKNN